MKVKEVYQKFLLPKNLQLHMLRVGALAKIITDNWQGSVIANKSILSAALIHDVAKPLTFDPDKQEKWGTQKELNNLRKMQNSVSKLYGAEEYDALLAIAKELKCNKKTLHILERYDWSYLKTHLANNDLNTLIAIYCDMRISPYGILPLAERIADVVERTKDKYVAEYAKQCNPTEKLLEVFININLHKITDQDLAALFEQLLEFEVV